MRVTPDRRRLPRSSRRFPLFSSFCWIWGELLLYDHRIGACLAVVWLMISCKGQQPDPQAPSYRHQKSIPLFIYSGACRKGLVMLAGEDF